MLSNTTRLFETNHSFLDTTREEHDPDGTTEALGGEVASELGSYSSTVSVMTSDLTPDASELRSALLGLGLVHVCDSLSKIERGILLGENSLNLDERVIGMLVSHSPLVSEDYTLGIQSNGSGRLGSLGNHF